jgi:aminopeptidase N
LKLFEQLPDLSLEDRFGVIDDLFALTGTGEVKISLAFRALQALKPKEDRLVLWETIIGNINSISSRVAREPVADDLSRMVLDIIGPVRNRLGWTVKAGESEEDSQLRPLIISAGLSNGNEDDISHALEMYYSGVDIPVELRSTVYYTVVRRGGEQAYQSMVTRYMNALKGGSDFERSRCMYALAQATKPSLLKRTLQFALSENVRSQDAGALIRAVARSPYGVDIAWEFVNQHHEAIASKIGDRQFQTTIVAGTTVLFATETKLEEVNALFSRIAPGMALPQALDQIKANIFWLSKNYQDLADYLSIEYPLQ